MASPRCTMCRKKLGLLEFTCKCEKKFCISHLQPEEHQCTYNYKIDGQAEIQKIMDTEVKTECFERL
jgi:predicted nucleic acid binding AN1-type Zn finger protein